MHAFGVKKSDIIILNKSVQFKKVYVPQQTLNISSARVSNKISDGYRAMARNVKSFGYDKVYMSRTKLKNNMNVLGEEKIQKIFKKNGYKIIYPETMSVIEQIAVVSEAKYLAGCAGTALHWALFMKPGGTVICLKRNSKDDINVRTQYMLNKVAGLNSVFIYASVEKYPSRHGGHHAPQIVGVNENLKSFFDDFGFKYDRSDTDFDSVAMNEYIQEYKKYKSEHGGVILNKFYKIIIKITSCFVLGRVNRSNFRHWLKKKLNV